VGPEQLLALVNVPWGLEGGSCHHDKSPTDPREYRSITLLSTLGKLLERCLAERIRRRTDEQISNRQYGFRKNRSCEMCIVAATQEIQKMRQAAKHTAAVAIDITGAFDNVQWRHILTQMEEMGVNKYLWLIVQSYFTGRVDTAQLAGA
jgi:hypothetical protein